MKQIKYTKNQKIKELIISENTEILKNDPSPKKLTTTVPITEKYDFIQLMKMVGKKHNYVVTEKYVAVRGLITGQEGGRSGMW